MSSLIKDKTLTLLINNNSGNIIINKLMNSLKNQQDGNNGKKKYIPLSLNNIKTFSLKNKNEKNNL